MVEGDCVFIDRDEPGGELALLYFPSLTTTGFDPEKGTIPFAFGKGVASGDSVVLVGGVIPDPPSGWVTRRHPPKCEAKAEGFPSTE